MKCSTFAGHWLERGVEMAEAVCRVRGISSRRIKPFPWWAINLASPFVNVCHEMLEMRYLWQVPLQLDNSKLRALIGTESHTPIEAALTATLDNRSRAIGAELDRLNKRNMLMRLSVRTACRAGPSCRWGSSSARLRP